MSLYESLQERFLQLRREAMWRSRFPADIPRDTGSGKDDGHPINFSSNDYLGLATHPEMKKAMQAGIEKFGVGSTASQLVCGYTSAHQALETSLCEITGRDRAILFSSGYMANLAMVTALCSRGDIVLGDRLNHASLNDAARLSAARFLRYPHVDVTALKKRLLDGAGYFRHAMVITESVFSMDGDIAPLHEIASCCIEQNALLAVDDAHGFGVLGEHGQGVLEARSLNQEQAPLLMITFGKALGSSGAAIIGKDVLLEQILQSARTLIYTTAPPPALAVATRRALSLLQEEAWRRERLGSNIKRFVRGAQERNLPLLDSVTPIQPLILGTADRAVQCSRQLLQRGFLITAIRPPTVPANTSRLRIVLSSTHTDEQIERLLDASHSVLSKLPQ